MSSQSINKDDSVINSWQDVVNCAKNSIYYENSAIIGSHNSISSSPEPCDIQKPLESIHRLTIRQVMQKAKNLPQIEENSVKKCFTPPVPKTIPNQILDDVQLFDFYYKNLDSIFIANGSANVTKSNHQSKGKSKRVSTFVDRRQSQIIENCN
jgi:hypothetical protein